jgi:purine-nucleoside phosphorylase
MSSTAANKFPAEMMKRIQICADFLKGKAKGHAPKIAVVLGSGLGPFADELQNRVEVPFESIPQFPQATVEGHSGAFVFGNLSTPQGGQVAVVALKGRLHFYEGHSMEDVALPTRVLGSLGVKTVVLTNAAGGVNPSFREGDIMIIEDHINFTGENPLRGPNLKEHGPRFPDMSHAYNPQMREALAASAAKHGIEARRGVYAWFLGPTYETPAEIRALRVLGADAVGMSTVPEVIVARHMGMNVAAMSCITNLGAGLTSQKLTHEDVVVVAKKAVGKIFLILKDVMATLEGITNEK